MNNTSLFCLLLLLPISSHAGLSKLIRIAGRAGVMRPMGIQARTMATLSESERYFYHHKLANIKDAIKDIEEDLEEFPVRYNSHPIEHRIHKLLRGLKQQEEAIKIKLCKD